MPGVMQRLRQGHAHLGGGTEHAVQPRHHDHADDGRHPAALLAHPLRPGPAQLHLAGGVGPVAKLVFQAHQTERVAAAIGQAPRHEETAQAARRLRQHQEAVGHRRGEEPLVPHQLVAAVGLQLGAGGVAAHVRAALLFGHAHAQGDAVLVGDGHIARIVMRRRRLVGPLGQCRVLAQHRDRGVGHGQRATGPGLGLVVQVAQRRACDVGTRAAVVPGQSGHAVALGRVHQPVVRRMELHGIDAMALRVVRAQPRPITVGIKAQRIQQVPGQPAVLRQPRREATAAFAFHRPDQGHVVGPQVAPGERWRLVEHLVGVECGWSGRHRSGLLAWGCPDSAASSWRLPFRRILTSCTSAAAQCSAWTRTAPTMTW
ncbi:hypothetical protein D3C71_1065750 [compost metagenome]